MSGAAQWCQRAPIDGPAATIYRAQRSDGATAGRADVEPGSHAATGKGQAQQQSQCPDGDDTPHRRDTIGATTTSGDCLVCRQCIGRDQGHTARWMRWSTQIDIGKDCQDDCIGIVLQIEKEYRTEIIDQCACAIDMVGYGYIVEKRARGLQQQHTSCIGQWIKARQ